MPTVRPSVKAAFFLACLAILSRVYFANTPIPLFLTRLKEVGLAAVILWSAGGWGMSLLQTVTSYAGCGVRGAEEGSLHKKNLLPNPAPRTPHAVASLTDSESFLFAEVLGLGCLSTLMIVLGVVSAWVPVGAWILLIAGVALSLPFLKMLKRLYRTASDSTGISSDITWPLAALWTGGILSFLLALAPITYYDSLVYHFALPGAYLRAHHWVPLPGLIYSSFPQTMEMLWSLGLLVGDDIVANLIGWSMSLFLLAAVIAYARRFLDLSVGFVAAALLALMPAFLFLSSGGYVDLGLTLFCFMALYAVCLWNENPTPDALIIGGLFTGWAVGTKYTGALPSGLIGIYLAIRLCQPLPVIASEAKQSRSSKGPGLLRCFAPRNDGFWGLLAFGGSALLVFSPWLIKNTLFVGNPVFPFFYKFGIKTLNPWVNEAAAGYFAGITEYYSRPLWTLPGVLWETAVNGIGFGRGVDVLGDFGWLPLIALLPGLWLCRQRSYYVKLLLIFSFAFFGFWALSRPVLRFLLPVCPLWALLAGYAWVHGVRPQAAAVRWISCGFLGAFLLSGLFLFFYAAGVLSPFGVALGMEDREAYLTRMLNYYGAAEFVNNQTPMNSRVYILGDQRGYYYQRTILISPVFSKNPMTEWANAAPDAKTLLQKLKDEGITHVVVNRPEFERLKDGYPWLRFNPQGQANWDLLQSKSLSLLYQDRNCDVYGVAGGVHP